MRFIFKHSSLYVTVEQLDTLWRCFVENALTLKESDLMFTWFSKICGSRYVFNPKEMLPMTAHIFEKKLCGLDFKNLTSAGFNCFEEYFRKYNTLKGTIEELEFRLNEFVIMDFQLHGLDALWNLALSVQNELVANMSITYLTSLYDSSKVRVHITTTTTSATLAYKLHCFLLVITSNERTTGDNPQQVCQYYHVPPRKCLQGDTSFCPPSIAGTSSS